MRSPLRATQEAGQAPAAGSAASPPGPCRAAKGDSRQLGDDATLLTFRTSAQKVLPQNTGFSAPLRCPVHGLGPNGQGRGERPPAATQDLDPEVCNSLARAAHRTMPPAALKGLRPDLHSMAYLPYEGFQYEAPTRPLAPHPHLFADPLHEGATSQDPLVRHVPFAPPAKCPNRIPSANAPDQPPTLQIWAAPLCNPISNELAIEPSGAA